MADGYNLGQAYIQIMPSAKGISGKISEALGPEADKAGKESGSKFSSSFGSAMGTVGKVAAAAFAAAKDIIAGTKELINATQEVARYGEEVDKMSQKLGLSSSAYQEWDYVMKLAGTEMSSMTTGLKTLTNQIDDAKNGSGEAQARFEKLGISLEDLNSMSREEIFEAVIGGFQDMSDSTERAALANDLFGRSGQNLNPLFNQTREATAAQIAEAREYGMVMGEDAVKASAAFIDSQTKLQSTITGVKNRMLSDLLPGFKMVTDGLSDLVAGTGDGATKIKEGISQIVTNFSSNLPKILDVVMSVASGIISALPTVAKTILDALPGIFNSLTGTLAKLIPSVVTDVLPALINACIQLIVSVVGHLSDIIRPIIQAIPTIVKSILSGIISNIPALVEGILDVVVTIASELPSMCNEIIKYIPELFAQLVVAIVKCIPLILSAVGELVEGVIMALFGIEDPIKETGEKMRGLGDAARDGWTEISEAFNQELDMSGLLSSLGHTSSEIQSEIDRLEGEITNIYATRLQEQAGLRAEDIEDIKNYQEQIRALEEEKLSIYGSQAAAQLEIMRGITNGTAEEYAERFALLQSADEQERAALEASYQQKYVTAENEHTLMLEEAKKYLAEHGGIEDEHYAQMLADAENAYTTATAKADEFYNTQNALISDREAEALNIMATANGSFIADTTSTYNQAAAATAAWQADSGEKMSQYCSDAQVMQAAANVTFSQLASTLSTTDAKNAAAWLSMAAKAKSGGAQLTGAAKDNALSILNAFQNVPSDLEDDAHQMIMGMANGLEDEIPALKNSSQMTAEEIANAIKDYLQISSPSRLMQSMGQNTVAGLTQGIKNSASSASSAMRSVGSSLVQGVGWGMQSMSGWLYNVAYNTVANAVAAAKRAGDIRSPSHVMRDEVGLMLSEGMALGIEDGEPEILSAVDEIGEHVNGAFSDIDIMDSVIQEAAGMPMNMKAQIAQASAETGRMIATARAETGQAAGADPNETLQELLTVLLKYFPEIIKIMGEQKGISPEALAQMLANPMSKELGKLERMNGRGLCLA